MSDEPSPRLAAAARARGQPTAALRAAAARAASRPSRPRGVVAAAERRSAPRRGPRARRRGPPIAASRAPRPQSSGLAIAAIVLGSLSIGLLLLSLGTSFLCLDAVSGAAWAFGARAQAACAGGRGPAQAAVVIGMVGVGLGSPRRSSGSSCSRRAFSLEDLRDYLERKLEEQRR